MRARNIGEMCAGEMDDLQGDNDAEKRWEEACRREEAIRDLLGRNPAGLKGRDVADLAWELGLSRATAYRMTRLFRAGGTVTSLMDRTRGPARRLSYTRQGARRNHLTGDRVLLSEAHQAAIFETVPTDPGELRKSGTSADELAHNQSPRRRRQPPDSRATARRNRDRQSDNANARRLPRVSPP